MSHNSSNQNGKPHHLYEIIDKEGEDVFKYGISFEPVGKDDTSGRMRKQISFLSRLYDEWKRFFGRIIIFDIPGKKEAQKLETKHIKDYEEKNGRKPKGNVRYKKTANKKYTKALPMRLTFNHSVPSKQTKQK